ncbi:MAG: response regulator transcription factor [Chloroflexi bacterium]|nr:response regulator transcription factor [Chloroflexota bacterium]
MTEKIKVLIADDHPVVRDGLRRSIMDRPDMTLAGEASDGLEAEQKALAVKPDVILMDISMPRRGGFETMMSIKQKLPGVKILILTISEQDEDLLQAVRIGANGYLTKRFDTEQIIDAIRRVAAGQAVLSSEMTTKLMDELKRKTAEPLLSGREAAILDLLAEGMTTSEIASRLYLSEGTVSTYARRLLEKLHLKNRAEAIAYAARHKTPKA